MPWENKRNEQYQRKTSKERICKISTNWTAMNRELGLGDKWFRRSSPDLLIGNLGDHLTQNKDLPSSI